MSDWWSADPVADGVSVGASGRPRITVTPAPRYDEAISSVESGGRYDALGPVTRTGDRAYGKYQVMGANIPEWTRQVLGRELTPQEFVSSPTAQDAVFKAKFGSYVQKYGPQGAARAWFAGEGGMNDLGRKDILGTTVAGYEGKFNRAMGFAPEKTAQPTQEQWWNGDPVAPSQSENPVQQRFSEPPAPENAAALRRGLVQRGAELTRGEPTEPMQNAAIDLGNQLVAAKQGTTPNIGVQQPNLISTDVYQSDAGDVLYKDPATGQVVPTDQAKHVVLRDPADNRLKVFARTPDTQESAAVGVARVLAPGLGAGAPTARAAIPLASQIKPGQQVAQAADRLGVEIPKAVATDSTALQRAASATRNVPLAGDPLVKSAERALVQIGDKATDVAQGYGGGTVYGSGDSARTAITRYITGTTKERAGKLYDAVDELVDNGVRRELSATKDVVAKISAARQGAALPEGKAVQSVTEAINRDGGLNYQGVKKLRSAIGEMVDNGILPEGMSPAEMKQIYGALSEDLAATVRAAGGGKASAAFDRANRYYKLVSDRREELARIVGKSGDAPAEQVFDRLVAKASSSSRGDIDALVKARKAIGADDWNDFVSGVVARLGRDPAAKVGPDAMNAADFSPQRFLTAYGKLSAQGRDILFRSGGKADLAQHLDDIATVSTRFKELQKFANPSGTSQNLAGMGLGAGIFADPMTTIGAVIGGRALATVLSRPATAAAAARWSRSYEQLARNPSFPRLASLEMASRNLVTNLKDVGVTASPQDFIKAIQGPMRSAAEDEQQ